MTTWRQMMKPIKTVGLIQVKLEYELYKKLKISCVEKQLKLKDAIEEAIKDYLNKEE